jgi:hypothetical protein
MYSLRLNAGIPPFSDDLEQRAVLYFRQYGAFFYSLGERVIVHFCETR